MSIGQRASTRSWVAARRRLRPDGPSASSSSRPPGSACSIQFGTSVSSAAPGSVQSLYLIVADIEAARDELNARGAQVERDLPRRKPRRALSRRRPRGRDPLQTAVTIPRSPRSTILTATAGCCRRSRNGSRAAERTGPCPRPMSRSRISRRHSGAPRGARRARASGSGKSRRELAGLVRAVHGA